MSTSPTTSGLSLMVMTAPVGLNICTVSNTLAAEVVVLLNP